MIIEYGCFLMKKFDFGSVVTGSRFRYQNWLLNTAFHCTSCTNKITSWYKLSDYFEELYYCFVDLIADALVLRSFKGLSSTTVGVIVRRSYRRPRYVNSPLMRVTISSSNIPH